MAEFKYKIGLSNADKATMANNIKDDVMGVVNPALSTIVNKVDKTDFDDLKDDVENKANIDGYYSTLHAGVADQLASPTPQYDNTPYVFRTSGGIADLGSGIAKIKSVKGNTKIFNQMIKNGDFSNGTNSWSVENGTIEITEQGRLKINSTRTTSGSYRPIQTLATPLVIGRKYLLSVGYFKQSAAGNESPSFPLFYVFGGVNTLFNNNTEEQRKKVIIQASVASTFLRIDCYNWDNGYFEVDDIMLIDLTLMYGVGNEPSTVAEFENDYPNAYYDYTLPLIKNVEVLGIETVGFNLFNGTYAKIVKNSLVSDNGYKIKGAFNKVYFNTINELNGDEIELTPDIESKVYPSEDGYLFLTESDNTSCISIVWSKWRDDDFEDYWKRYTEIESGKLNGIGDIYDEITKTHKIQRFNVVDLGSLTWQKQLKDGAYFYTRAFETNNPPDLKRPISESVAPAWILSTKYKIVATNRLLLSGDMVLQIEYSNGRIEMVDSSHANLSNAEIKTALSGVYLVYALKEESYIITEHDKNLQYVVDDFGTEEFILSSDSLKLPIAHLTSYLENLRDKVRRLPSVAEVGSVSDLETIDKTLVGAINELKNGLDSLRVEAPLTNTSLGVKGQWAVDSNYFYACVSDNIWKRIAFEEDSWGEEE